MNLKTSVIHRKGAKSAKDAKKNKGLSEMSADLVIHLLGEWAKAHKLLFPLRSLYLCTSAVRISGLIRRQFQIDLAASAALHGRRGGLG